MRLILEQHALISGAPHWIAVAMGNIHMKKCQEQK